MDRFILEEFLLIFVRTTAFMFAAPFFSIRTVPVYIKVGFGLILAALLYPVLNLNQVAPDAGSSLYWLSVIQETLVGPDTGFYRHTGFFRYQNGGAVYRSAHRVCNGRPL
ncbi:MAG: flagellar biosynthetic protein FliR [Bacillota bacterium]